MTKYTSKLMTTRQAINDQTKYDPIFCPVIRDRELATKTTIWSFICEFWFFFVTYLSLFVTNLIFLIILYANFGHLIGHFSLICH